MQTYPNFQALQNDNPELTDFARYQLSAGAYKDYFNQLDHTPALNPRALLIAKPLVSPWPKDWRMMNVTVKSMIRSLK